MYYQHSGRFSLGGVLIGLLVGTAGSILLAYAYGRGIIVIPEVHLAAFATFFFGALIGSVTGWGLILGKVRNRNAAIVVSALTSIIGLYSSWAVWIANIYRRGSGKYVSWGSVASRPGTVWAFMKWINRYGTWGLDSGRGPTNGWLLWGIWGSEALIVLGTSIAVAYAVLQQLPFCETCSRWGRAKTGFVLALPPHPEQLKSQLETDGLRPLEQLGPGPKVGDRLVVSLLSCSQCGLFHAMTVRSVSRTPQKFGHPRVTMKNIVRHLVVSPEQAQALRQLSEKIAQTTKLAAERARGTAAGV